ncbi:MAG: helix-turn-helix domain-containing protein [Pseudonocardiaceae bacterium]
MAGKRHRLVSARKTVGFSQERLAKALGVERSTVMRWARGETRPQPWARPKLAGALGISAQALSELLGDVAEPEGVAEWAPAVLVKPCPAAWAGPSPSMTSNSQSSSCLYPLRWTGVRIL